MMISAISPYNSYNKYTNSFGLRKGRNMPGYYQKSHQDFNSVEVSQKLTNKYATYPMAIKGIVMLLPEYFNGKIDTNTFAKNFLDRTPTLLIRSDLTNDGRDFEKAYGREFSLIKSLDHFCYEYAEGKMRPEEFNHFTEIHAKEFLKA